jgi:hypothetical protein
MRRLFAIGSAVALIVAMTAVCVSVAADKAQKQVPYPEGYRQWAHVKTMVIQEGHKLHNTFGGIHHVYANKPALEAMQKGKPFPKGAVLVLDLLDTKSQDNSVTEGARKMVGVMHKDAKAYAETGGWGFEGFKGDTKDRVVTDMKTCFKCHEGKKDTDYVFSQWRK